MNKDIIIHLHDKVGIALDDGEVVLDVVYKAEAFQGQVSVCIFESCLGMKNDKYSYTSIWGLKI